MSHIPWRTAIVFIILLLALIFASIGAEAQAWQPTTLGRWAQSISRTPVAVYMGCNLEPPYSTRCWRHVPDGSGGIAYTIYYRQLPNGGVAIWRSAK